MVKSLLYFLAAGLCEIGGGYLVWLWLREGRSVWLAAVGAAVLVLYGVIPTFQPANFGRVYAAYGGVFVALSILWGWRVDGVAPLNMIEIEFSAIARQCLHRRIASKAELEREVQAIVKERAAKAIKIK